MVIGPSRGLGRRSKTHRGAINRPACALVRHSRDHQEPVFPLVFRLFSTRPHILALSKYRHSRSFGGRFGVDNTSLALVWGSKTHRGVIGRHSKPRTRRRSPKAPSAKTEITTYITDNRHKSLFLAFPPGRRPKTHDTGAPLPVQSVAEG